VLQLVSFMAPAYAANMAPPLVGHWRGWNPPISSRWLGGHKTVLGFLAGVLAALATAFAQHGLGWVTDIDRGDGWLDLGLRLGVGAMAGDSAKSFFKRLLGIAPGRPWIPFDQLDFVLGALLVVWPRAALTAGDVAIVLGVSVAGHVAVTHAAYWLGIRDVKW
jgi:CDP-2,3-bis-(O-geranylgeranyl)-sn-glycerol synthase